MLDIAPNPFAESIKRLIQDLKDTKWKFPFILQIIHGIITVLLLIILSILYFTLGFISQISNSFWDVIAGMGQQMSFSNPFPSLFYAISIAVYFLLFLPFFLIQFPFWISGWLTSRIGFKPFIILMIIVIGSLGIYFFQPELASDALSRIIKFQNSIGLHYFASDSTLTQDSIITNLNIQELSQK